MFHKERKYSTRLLCGAAATALAMFSSIAHAQESAPIDIAAQPLAKALGEFAAQTKRAVLVTPDLTAARVSRPVNGATDPETALVAMLDGSGLTYRQDGDTFLIVKATQDPQSGSAAGAGAEVEALIVTAQKKEEQIQDVPIAISAFTQQALEEQKIEGGFDLLKAIPNVTFSKNNFSGYNFSIRGIGTKAISATTDPGVAVAFNNTTLIQNRLFEQEYFDVERVEVLRGPQGTLYGRNATSGVINVISAKPDLGEFAGSIKAEVGNYDAKRIVGMVNIPLVEDRLALRFAGSMTSRDGYGYNAQTKNNTDGRDLWSARITVGFEPTERLRGNLIWERFEEDDNRSRTSKQLCHRDPGLTQIGSEPVVGITPQIGSLLESLFSQGCKPGSLYDDAAFGTPNGLAIPFVWAVPALSGYCGPNCVALFPIGYSEPRYEFNQPTPDFGYWSINPDARAVSLIEFLDPYGGMTQSRDLREISSFRDPIYRAHADVFELNIDFDVTDALTLSSQTTYNEDQVYSFQDYNRFNTVPVFSDTAQLYATREAEYTLEDPEPRSVYAGLAPGGIFCDPQLGCSSSIAGFDISQAHGKQFSQEIRLQSSFDGPLNFNFGANYTKFDTVVDYYVMYNLITALALMQFNTSPDVTLCGIGLDGNLLATPLPNGAPGTSCPYVDPNPVESIDGEGHNYFRSKNPYKLTSSAVFGELYWRASDTVKVTAGLRYTDDRKTFTPVPSQVLLAPFVAGGDTPRGYPADPDIKQKWGEFTGRLGFDWKPVLSFTDETMLYAFYSRGYKGGGANPPGIGLSEVWMSTQFGFPEGVLPTYDRPFLELTAVNYPETFRAEFVNAFEVGAKNTLLGGAMIFNAGAFFYDYKDYQVSKIVDRTAVNENFDARIWGLEFETVFRPSSDLRINASFGYLDTEIGAGAKSIDIMNRTQSNPDWTVVKPWVQLPSNCIVPTAVAENFIEFGGGNSAGWYHLCRGFNFIPIWEENPQFQDPNTGAYYTPTAYPEINGGAGFADDLEGNELPNSPHWTISAGAQYGVDFLDRWRATVRADAYWQSQSWARVHNAVNDKLHGWYNANLSLWIENDDGLKIELYAKNILDETPITDAFINSDDTALTTNVFVLDPRLIGLSIRKEF